MTETKKGKIKFFNEQKGYGFVTPEQGTEDLFVHISNVQDGKILSEGQLVSFEVRQSPRGLEAINVQIVE